MRDAYLALTPRRWSSASVLAGYALIAAVLVTALPAVLGGSGAADVVSARISTLLDVGHDESALDREAEISAALQQGLDNPSGSGLGTLGAASKLGTEPGGGVRDDRRQRLPHTLHRTRLAGHAGLCGRRHRRPVGLGVPPVPAQNRRRESRPSSPERPRFAMCAALAWGDAADEAHLGVQGMFFWGALGICSLAVRSCSPAPRSRALRSAR